MKKVRNIRPSVAKTKKNRPARKKFSTGFIVPVAV